MTKHADIHPLVAYRKSQKPWLTQDDLAEQLGVCRFTILRWETGKRKIDPAMLGRVSEVTGIPAAELRPDLASLLGAA